LADSGEQGDTNLCRLGNYLQREGETVMTYHGHIKNGQITLDEPVSLPEGAEVNVELVGEADAELNAVLLRHAGRGQNLPADLAEHHDHYAHGKPKS
jgi:hypothetical protein